MSRHLRLPLALGTDGGFGTVEEDSDDEVVQNTAVVLRTRPGERLATTELGLPDPTFIGVDVALALDVVQRWEPRADVALVDQLLDGSGREVTTLTARRRA